jgi:hypothetical protein
MRQRWSQVTTRAGLFPKAVIAPTLMKTQTEDERKAIDVLMTKLRSLVQELKFRLIVINHLRRVDRTSHEEGDQVSLPRDSPPWRPDSILPLHRHHHGHRPGWSRR